MGDACSRCAGSRSTGFSLACRDRCRSSPCVRRFFILLVCRGLGADREIICLGILNYRTGGTLLCWS